MLYVFHVDTGRMIKFEMNVALSSVQNLKDMIERLHGIPASKLVLLVSGGEVLSPGSLVCSYSAGTDTNPIYMFSTVDTNLPPWPSIEPDMELLKDQVERCLSLPATISTVITRAQLAQQIYDLAHEEQSISKKLVHEQHLQQQGWAAVIANMEDLTEEFRQRFHNFSKCFDDHLCRRKEYLELLGQFNQDIENLARIPILPGLMQNAEEDFHGFDEILANDDVLRKEISQTENLSTTEIQPTNNQSKENTPESYQSSSSSELRKNRTLTLLQWISAKDNHKTLKIMAAECIQGLSSFDEEKIETLKNEVISVVKAADHDEIKEIRGLEDRLCGLENLMFELKKIVKQQRENATAFQQNQTRASNLGDASILPDLCESHRNQLRVMLQSEKIIFDMRKRIANAKEELSSNLNKRLKYIIQIENRMSELDNNLLFYHRCLRRVERHIGIIQQIHQTPSIYVQAVSEVVRRRQFSNAFISWASNISYDLLTIHNAEIERRREFNCVFEGHFLNSLFPGMNDMPPSFTNETSYIFDASLPNITKTDIDTLATYLPEISSNSEPVDMGSVIEFFLLRSGNKNVEEKNSMSGRSQSTGTERTAALLYRPIDIHAHLKDGFESETDTEEFEKVGQSPNERQLSAATTATAATSTNQIIIETASASTSTEPLIMHTVETLTEENLGSTRIEVERLKSIIKSMGQISNESLKLLKDHLESFRNESGFEKSLFQTEFVILIETINKLKNDYELKEKETIDNMKSVHEIEIIDLRKALESKEKEIEFLLKQKSYLEIEHNELVNKSQDEKNELQNEIKELKQSIEIQSEQLKNVEIDKEKAITACRERLIHEHKTEIESLRCRFKLMTSMERSPSDTSLEKIERHDMIEVACHELILQQTREDLNREKANAIKAAIEYERLQQNSLNFPTNDLIQKVIEEKDKLLDSLRERDMIISKENSQLKLKIESLTNEDESDRIWFKDKIDLLNKDKIRLENELMLERSRRISAGEPSTSSAGAKYLANRAEVRFHPELCSSLLKLPLYKLDVVTDSCNKNDIVFVVWNSRHGQYTIIQDNTTTLFFLHADCLALLNLRIPRGIYTGTAPDILFAIGRVFEKEYCHAKKSENRYNVVKGTKFYRVKVYPLHMSTDIQIRRDRHESTSSSSCTSVSRSTSTLHLTDSSAQTNSSAVPSTSKASRDMLDSVEVKDKTEEEDDVLSGKSRYLSLSEEEENAIAAETLNDQGIASNFGQILTESSSEKDQDDSDEYRSLETKDENDFPTNV